MYVPSSIDLESQTPTPSPFSNKQNNVALPRPNSPRLLPRLSPKPNPLRNNPLLPPKRARNKLLLRTLIPARSPHPSKPKNHLSRRRLPRLPRCNSPLHAPNRAKKAPPGLRSHRPGPRRRDPARNPRKPQRHSLRHIILRS